MSANRYKLLVSFSMLFILLSFGYSNCAPNFDLQQANSNKLSSNAQDFLGGGTLCEQNLKALFQTGYAQFSQTNCATCHANGPGKGRFASSNLTDAYDDFNQIGYARISENAINENHNPPYSGPQHIQTINQLRVEWQQGLNEYAKCSGETVSEPSVPLSQLLTVETIQKGIPLKDGKPLDFGQTQTLSWVINTEMKALKSGVTLPNLPSGVFSIRVGKYKTGGGEAYYTFTLPRLAKAQRDALVKTIQVKVNGRLLTFPTTFKFVNTGIYANSAETDARSLITTGSLVSPGALSTEDKISVAFEKLEETTLPPPKAPVQVNFSTPSMNWVTPTTGYADVEISLSEPADTPVTVTVSSDTTNVCGSTSTSGVDVAGCEPALANFICNSGGCPSSKMLLRAKSVVGTTFNRFDWDYKFTSSALTFQTGETKKTIRVLFSTDIRKENNRLFTLQIDEDLLNAVRGSAYKVHYVINKLNNPTPPAGVPTFSELMQTTGILGFNCVKCHNSKDLAGGYDMTNYDLMRSKNIIIPFNVDSLMYGRMNPNSSAFKMQSPMPIEGQLPVELRKEVENWILNGAYNN